MKDLLRDLDPEEMFRGGIDFSACDSPIEDIFFVEYQKYRNLKVEIRRQVECRTHLGLYRLDFVLEVDGRRIAVECDGKNYHDHTKDFQRDRAILKTGLVQRVYRLRGTDIFSRLPDLLDIFRSEEPRMFSDRGHKNIDHLATRSGQCKDDYYGMNNGKTVIAIREYPGAEDDEQEEERPVGLSTMLSWTG